MTRLSLRLAALALLSLSACDSAEDETSPSPSALVGSWSLAEVTTESFVTVSEAQPLVDRNGPVTGSVTTSGAEAATFRFMRVEPQFGEAILTSYDPRLSPPATRYELRMTTSGYSRLSVSRPDGSFTEYDSYGATPAYTYADGRLTVRPTTLQNYFTGEAVTVAAGTLAYPVVQLSAGARTLVRSTTDPFDGTSGSGVLDVRYVFESDGGFRAERDFTPNVTRSVAGTWAVDGPRLRLSVAGEQPSETFTETFDYVISGGRLSLGVVADECRANVDCLRYVEQQYGLRAGTLTASAVEMTTVFAETAAAATRPALARGSGAASQSAASEARREAAVWPRLLARTDAP